MKRVIKNKKLLRRLKEIVLIGASVFILITGGVVLWVATFQLPDLNAFEQRKVSQSTKIYDKTGNVLLYDVHQDIRRTLVPYSDISRNIKNATVAIEDAEFYQHAGIKPTSIMRAVLKDLFTLHFTQGGSTITQQVVKNAFLTSDKTISRKLKEWVLALKLERVLDKDTILGIYLNEVPYGGNIYGVEEASQAYFAKHAKDLDLAESAYLAALPQAPTYYSPYGTHLKELNARKNLVLSKMLENKFITKDEYTSAKNETVGWSPADERNIKAPHFVMYIKQYLTDKYGEQAVEQNGYKVTTTLDYSLQEKAQQILKQYALENKKTIDAENAALVAIDPKTGQILAMVGSRDYFDTEINGNFNVALAHRQPGSAFKPFAYAMAFKKGYLPETVVFDVKTEFSTSCTIDSAPRFPSASCYSPSDYDNKFRGPMHLRDALAQSINVPAIKVLYLAGLKDTLNLAKDMGIQSLGDPNQYGLTLVLGGGEVSLLDLTSAYSVFANDGLRNSYTGILNIEDKNGNVIEQYQKNEQRVLDADVAEKINDVLSDNQAKVPSYGANSPLFFDNRDVASKTGTTNDYRDTWVEGYTPNIAVGIWAGNNDNRPIQKNQVARLVVAPMWRAVMDEALKNLPNESFKKPDPTDLSIIKPIIRGVWQGGQTYSIDTSTGNLATAYTPAEFKQERVVQNVHSILYWVDKDNPLGPPPSNPSADPQFQSWEYGVRKWASENGYGDQTSAVIPSQTDTNHNPSNAPVVSIINPNSNSNYTRDNPIIITMSANGKYPLSKAEYYINNNYIGSSDKTPFVFSFVPKEIDSITNINTLRVVITDSIGNKGETSSTFTIGQ